MTYQVPAVENAVKLLNCLRDSQNGKLSLSELCNKADVPRSSGLNIVRTLEAHGLVVCDRQTKKYSLGWGLVQLGYRAQEQTTYLEAVRPYLHLLVHDVGVTSILAQLIADQLMISDKVESSHDVRASATVGQFYPLTSGALGKAVLAYLGSGEVRSYVNRMGLPSFTEFSITRIDDLFENLTRIRELGYATSYEEYVRGVNAVAAPVFDSSGEPYLSVCALGLTQVLPTESLEDVGTKVVETARKMTSAIGGVWQGPALPQSAQGGPARGGI